MKTPFKNDPFALVWQAFKNLYPEKDCICFWDVEIKDEETGKTACGFTNFAGGEIVVCVSSGITVVNAVEIFAHELAHVAVGEAHDHDKAWEAAFDAIFKEYNRVGKQLFAEEKQ